MNFSDLRYLHTVIYVDEVGLNRNVPRTTGTVLAYMYIFKVCMEAVLFQYTPLFVCEGDLLSSYSSTGKEEGIRLPRDEGSAHTIVSLLLEYDPRLKAILIGFEVSRPSFAMTFPIEVPNLSNQQLMRVHTEFDNRNLQERTLAAKTPDQIAFLQKEVLDVLERYVETATE